MPTALKLLKGNPGKRPINDAEPKPSKKRPICPTWIDVDAKAMWKRLIPMLSDMGVLTEVDGNAVARYCQLWSRWKRAEQFIQKNGDVFPIKAEDGSIKYLQQFPQVGIANNLAAQLNRLETEFGLTPSSRSRIRIEKGSDRMDEFERFINSGSA